MSTMLTWSSGLLHGCRSDTGYRILPRSKRYWIWTNLNIFRAMNQFGWRAFMKFWNHNSKQQKSELLLGRSPFYEVQCWMLHAQNLTKYSSPVTCQWPHLTDEEFEIQRKKETSMCKWLDVSWCLRDSKVHDLGTKQQEWGWNWKGAWRKPLEMTA